MNRGFCLAEVLIAAGLLASGLVGVAYVFAVATRAAVDARMTTSAIVLATQKLEMFRSAPFDEEPSGERLEYLDTFVRRTRIEAYPWDPVNTLVIHVNVWRYGQPQTGVSVVHLSALKTRTGS